MRWYDNPQKVLRYLWLIPRLLFIVIGPLTGLLNLAGPNLPGPPHCQSCLGTVAFSSPDNGWAAVNDNAGLSGSKNEILHYAAGAWHWEFLPIDRFLNDVTGITALNANDAWATYDGFDEKFDQLSGILHYHNGQWQKVGDISVGTFGPLVMLSDTDGWTIHYTSDTKQVYNTVLHFDGHRWAESPMPGNPTLSDIAFAASDDGWVVGEKGYVAHESNGVWQTVPSFTQNDLMSVHVLGQNDVWTLDAAGNIWHYDGTRWRISIIDSPTSYGPLMVFSPDDVWIVQEQLPQNTTIIWHYSDGVWATMTPPTVAVLDLSMVAPDEGWAVGINPSDRLPSGGGQNGPGLIAHYQNGVWQVSDAPREAEPWWVTLSRVTLIVVMLVALGFIAWFIRLSSVLESPSLLKTWYARVTLIFTVFGLGGAGLTVAEPLLSPQYNSGMRLIGLFIAIVSLIVAIISVVLLERKHKRTPTPVNPADLVVQPVRAHSEEVNE